MVTKEISIIPTSTRWNKLGKHRTPYLYVSPFFILFAIFGIYPAIYALILSLFQWGGRHGYLEVRWPE